MQEIINSIAKVREFLQQIPLSQSTVNDYQIRYNSILAYCKSNEITCFSKLEAKTFTDILNMQYETGYIGDRQLRKMRRCVFLLAACMEGEELVWKSVVFPVKTLSEYYTGILIDFKTHLSQLLSSGSVRGIISTIRKFLCFLESIKILNLTSLMQDHVRCFLKSVTDEHKGSMGNLIWAMRRFILFLNESNLSPVNADRHLLCPAPNRKKVLPCFTHDETDAILSVADKTSNLGKRDYAIMKLAIETGLRVVDILNLKLSDINWRKCEITVIQDKTDEAIHLPLFANVGNAIVDYILNARPESDSSYVFLRTVRPYTKLGNVGSGNNILSRYLDKAGIQHNAWDGKTFHAFRRSQGTRLVEAEVPIPDVADLLGHKDLDSAKRYISHSNDRLRTCCLDISEFATGKEGLV